MTQNCNDKFILLDKKNVFKADVERGTKKEKEVRIVNHVFPKTRLGNENLYVHRKKSTFHDISLKTSLKMKSDVILEENSNISHLSVRSSPEFIQVLLSMQDDEQNN